VSTAILVKLFVERKDDELYVGPDGWMFGREWVQKSPNGNPFNGVWVLRDGAGNYVDHDQYRNDLAERNGFKMRHLNEQ
jgi:hypothetical protein